MKKILAISGSPRGKKSTGYALISELFNKIKAREISINTEIVNLSECDIKMCKGCTKCFASCNTCMQFNDDIELIENKMLSSDVILFSSPVYAHAVTGTMKNFLDRISHWVHIFRLAGKYCMILSTSDSNGNAFIDRYLSDIAEYMGLSVICCIDHKKIKPISQYELQGVAERIVDCLENDMQIFNLEYKNKLFNLYRKVYADIYRAEIEKFGKVTSKEAIYWQENGYFECEEFEDLLKLDCFNT